MSSFPQQSRRRKLVYFGVIALLWCLIVFVVKPFMNSEARALELREESLGEVRLTDAAIRLTLTGSRGLVVCYLWNTAQEKQKRHEWNELELIVNSITKL